MAHGIGPQHQPGKVEVPLALARDIWTVDVAKLALETLVDDRILFGLGQSGGILVVVSVDVAEQRGKRRAELETQAAAMAKVVDPRELGSDVVLIEVLGIVGIVNSGQATRSFSVRSGCDAGLRAARRTPAPPVMSAQ